MPHAAPFIEIRQEQDAPRGWVYAVVVTTADAGTTEHEIALSWVDHDHWSGGASSPSQVVEAVLTAVLSQDDAPTLPERFDLATARRWAPDLDERLRL